ncbi:hypothetical protein AVEN_79847-1 [Araneus ventricosus]|uniref:Uncharacterized protein n=1 Tax=Araneus ventricosus TaxID=182803 RepID=A0A4Y2PNY5_ARAVE|nr:hypothetical protein AVEN_79847-1 [Araneus ventricosus]
MICYMLVISGYDVAQTKSKILQKSRKRVDIDTTSNLELFNLIFDFYNTWTGCLQLVLGRKFLLSRNRAVIARIVGLDDKYTLRNAVPAFSNVFNEPAGVFSPKLSRILPQKGAVSRSPAWLKKFEPTVIQNPMTIRRFFIIVIEKYLGKESHTARFHSRRLKDKLT